MTAVAALAVAAVMLAPQAAAATIGGFGARPAHFDPRVPATRAYFIDHVARGAAFTDHLIVFNDGRVPLPVRVYPVDGLTGATSGIVYGNRGTPRVGAGRWVTTGHSDLVIPAHSQMRVAFDVHVPASAAPGVHLAGLAVQEADPRTSGGRFSVTEVLRTVVGIEMILPGPARSQIALRHVQPVTGSPTGAAFVVKLSNVGTGLCKPDLTLGIRGADGAHEVARRLDTVLPGDTIPYVVAWPRTLPAGHYRETAIATGCGSHRVLKATAVIGHAQPAAGHAATSRATVAASTSGTPWVLILLIGAGGIGVGGIGVGAILSRDRRRGHSGA